MARVVLACELGTGRAHLRRLLALAAALRQRQHDVVLVVNDLNKAEQVLGDQGFVVLPCPTWRSPVAGLPPLRNYTDILLRQGFIDAAGLRGLARAWQHLVGLLQPGLMVFDHAPVALFATRGLGVPRLRFGDGWGCPPLQTPMPQCAWWTASDDPFDAIGERNVLHVANQVASDLGLPAARSVADFLQADDDFVCTLPELDHYSRIDASRCRGPVLPPADAAGPDTPWPAGDGPCAYVYLRPDCAQLDALAQALRQRGWRALMHVPGLPPGRAKALAGAGLQLSPLPVPADQVASRAQLSIGHGGYALVHAMALAGLPQLLLSQRLEQQMLGHRVQAAGAGRVAAVSDGVPELDAHLRHLQGDGPRGAAAALAGRHAGVDPEHVLQEAVLRCESMATAPPVT